MKDLIIDVNDARAQLAAIRNLSIGKIAVLPTDTVYGLHGLATFEGMRRKLGAVKGGDGDSRGYILLVHCMASIEKWARLDEGARQFLERYSPGPVSVILEAAAEAPDAWVSVGEQGQRRIAFRIPDVPFLCDLLDVLGAPLFSTSANLAGQAPLETASEIVKLFGDKVDLVVADKDLEHGIAREGASASALVDLTCRPPRVLREGKIPFALTASSPPG